MDYFIMQQRSSISINFHSIHTSQCMFSPIFFSFSLSYRWKARIKKLWALVSGSHPSQMQYKLWLAGIFVPISHVALHHFPCHFSCAFSIQDNLLCSVKGTTIWRLWRFCSMNLALGAECVIWNWISVNKIIKFIRAVFAPWWHFWGILRFLWGGTFALCTRWFSILLPSQCVDDSPFGTPSQLVLVLWYYL